MRLNDLDFHVEIEGTGPPLLLLHGFTGSARAWNDLRAGLSDAFTLIAPDLIGHARSAAPAVPARYGMAPTSDDLAELLDQLGLERASVLGYSMGGRVALCFAATAPHRIDRLVLESASPGIEDAAERERRAQSDDRLADDLERDGLAAFVARWEAQPLLAPAPHVPQARRVEQHAIRLDHSPLGLANSLRGMGTGRQPSVWSVLPSLAVPTLLVAGALDQRYCDIARRMHAALPCAKLSVIGEAGHTVHVDQPAEFERAVRGYFAN